jgi:glycosyltransferase involved in cell wall biosynthesis
VQRPKRIFYVGTYDRDYPRNTIVIAGLRRAGFDVRELNAPIWAGDADRSSLVGAPVQLLRLAIRLTAAYVKLIVLLLARRRQFDLVSFGYIGQADVLILGSFVKLLGKPILFNPLVTLTDTLIEDRARLSPWGLMAKLIRLVYRLSLRIADVVLVDTRENRDYLMLNFHVAAERVLVLPVGADETVFNNTVSPDQISDQSNARRVLFYGNMIPLQGVETIVRAARLLQDDTNVIFEVIGTGQTYAEIRSVASQLDVQNIVFVDRVPYAELPCRIRRSDVVLGIFGSTTKAARVVPNKVYQGMAMGAAIVTRDSSATREVLRDGESALLVLPSDPESLACAIRMLSDSELRHRLGTAARARFLEVASLDVQARCLTVAVETALAVRHSDCREAVA